MWLTCAPRLSLILIRPSYAPPFQDWSETGPGVRSATLSPPRPPDDPDFAPSPEHATSTSKQSVETVENSALRRILMSLIVDGLALSGLCILCLIALRPIMPGSNILDYTTGRVTKSSND